MSSQFPDRLRGIIPVLATPFDASGRIDYGSFESQLDMTIRDGADTLVMFGLASEYYKLTDEERRELVRVLRTTTGSRIPFILSVTHHATEIAIQQAREAEQAGASAVMILPPFFLDPALDAILEHIEAVAGSVRIPAILQYAPAQTQISPDVLARVPVSIIKIDAVPYAPAAATIPPDRVRLAGYMGLDLPDAVAAGCDGCMPTASLVPEFRRLWELLAHDPGQGRDYHNRLLPLLRFMMQSIEFLIACEKHLLTHRKAFRTCGTRRPAARLNPEEVRTLFQYFDEL